MTEADFNTGFDLQLIRGFFDAETCQEILTEMRSSSASPAVTYGQSQEGSVNEGVRKVLRVMPSHSIVERVTRRLMECCEEFSKRFDVELSECEDPQFLRYRVGDFFVAHQDGNTGLLQLDTEARRVSVSIFLNRQSQEQETDAYCGGSLVFHDWRNRKEFSLVADAGTLVAFRSETTHEVIPVTSGERYSIVSWYR